MAGSRRRVHRRARAFVSGMMTKEIVSAKNVRLLHDAEWAKTSLNSGESSKSW